MKKILLIVFTLAFTLSAFAQTGSLPAGYKITGEISGGIPLATDGRGNYLIGVKGKWRKPTVYRSQAAPQASPAPIATDKPVAKAKEFKPELTPEESALLRPVIDDFNKWSAKLNAASEQLDKSEGAASPEVESLQIQLAAKDIRAARRELKRVQGEFQKWQAEINKNHDCADCRFDEATGKLVKPPAKQ